MTDQPSTQEGVARLVVCPFCGDMLGKIEGEGNMPCMALVYTIHDMQAEHLQRQHPGVLDD